MADIIRLSKVLRELNISMDRAIDFLESKNIEIEKRPTTKISTEVYELLSGEFQTDASKKVASKEVGQAKQKEKEALRLQREEEALKKEEEAKKVIKAKTTFEGPKKVGKIDLNPTKPKSAPKPKLETSKSEKPKTEEKPKKDEVKKVEKSVPKSTNQEPVKETPKVAADSGKVKTQYAKLSGPKSTGQTIDLSQFNKPKKTSPAKESDKSGSSDSRKKRKRISKVGRGNQGQKPRFNKSRNQKPSTPKVEPTAEEVQKQVRETLEKLQGKSSKGKGAKYRRDKRDQHRQQTEKDLEQQAIESKTLKVTEFVTANEVATMMDVSVTEIISACMSLGMMVTMNQRLDAETLSIVAEEFGYTVDFVTADIDEIIEEVEDKEEDLLERAPIVTVMGHVDHGKTSLLDYIREENVIAGESGGITQHIGAYGVTLASGQKIAFLDTPGHEAFTAMRARGAQVTDIAIIVIAADDNIKPQTKEAISHAQAAGVPIVFAINKVDLPTANPDKIKEGLANMNLMVEDWGGKIQSHDISAKNGDGIQELLEKVLLEAELLELKANPNKAAVGTIVEAFLDKGRGYVSTVLVQAGTLRIGDYVLAGKNSGKIKAMQDERGQEVSEAGPSTPISILGLDGAPQAGDKFNVFKDEREAKQIAAKRTQLQREQSVRTQRHITLDEIGRRIALGDFKELNIILKGDVDGSVEALTDSFQKLSTEEIQVNIIHKAVGAITESDVLLASASDAIIIGFNVRPMGNARQIAEKEEIDIRMYSIIYDAINDLKDAMEGMLSPEFKEEITGSAEIRETFKISKIGTIAGCMVTNGKIFRNSQIRIIREGVVIYTGELASLKRFKDDAKEVSKGYDCGMQIKNYNDIQLGDVFEAFQEVAVKKKL
jgi:translation initiation factor IF-2|tara:strand:- start:3579 stop:6233 length:2655 start_codon:yes stop_codon:yes gene_type:complete